MAYGRELGELVPAKPVPQDQEEREVDRFQEGTLRDMLWCSNLLASAPVLQEIEERKTFLAEMEELGRGKEHQAKIMTEISQVCGSPSG